MRVVIVEDSDLVYAALLEVLADCVSVDVVGRAVSQTDAIAMILSQAPDVVLLDLSLSPGSGLEVLRTIRDAGSTSRVFVVSNQSEDAMRIRCLQEGADAFFDKCSDLNLLVQHLERSTGAVCDAEPVRIEAFANTAASQSKLDEIVAMTAELTGCPTAGVTLLGANRQWFVSTLGTPLTSTSRHISLCAHVAGAQGLLEIPDVLADERFALNPIAHAPFGIRFYAGAPITLSDGRIVGALCVLAAEPRALSDAQRDALLALARRASAHIDEMRAEPTPRPTHEHAPADADALTGLPCRNAFLEQTAAALGDAATRGSEAAVLSIGIDRMTRLNHTFGRDGGDIALVQIARELRRAAPSDAFVARLDSDQFAVLLRNVDGVDALTRIGESLAEAVGTPMVVNGRPVRMHCSVGMASGSGESITAPVITAHAELAMQKAKRLGGNMCQQYASWMSVRAVDRVILEADLRAGIPAGELVLAYQPQIDIATRRVIGMEALVRWNHPKRGLLPPDMFIPLAEETGLIVDLGASVLDMAIAQMASWRADGLDPPTIAVNVSAMQLTREFPALVAATLCRHGIEATALELELTESALPRADHAMDDLLLELRESGVGLAIDDFGVGYSSLAALRRLPVTTLKIDRSFITDLGASEQHAAVVGAIISMAQTLGMKTVAEGIEDEVAHACLASLQCDRAQGYLYCRPIAPDAMADLLHGARTSHDAALLLPRGGIACRA
ncbi:putative bifunctional diguanylate cyclase/phosphodiesterase [Lysobacter sp. HA35]